jgi:CHASE domain
MSKGHTPPSQSSKPPPSDPKINDICRCSRPYALMERSASTQTLESCEVTGGRWRRCRCSRLFLHYQPFIFSALIVCLGAVASAAIVTLGLRGAQSASQESFQSQAKQMAHAVNHSWHEYETLLVWVHESCDLIDTPALAADGAHTINSTADDSTPSSSFLETGEEQKLGFCSRGSFQHLVEHIDTIGLDFVAIQFAPNISSQAARMALELESARYYMENHPAVSDGYVGIKSMELMEGGVNETYYSPEKPFYFPAHFVHPLKMNENTVDLDMYSFNKACIDKAFRLSKPVMEHRIKILQDPRPEVWGMGVSHPGVITSADPSHKDHGITRLVFRPLDLIKRGATHLEFPAQGGMSVDIYDETGCDPNFGRCDPVFLAGMDIRHGEVMRLHNGTRYADLLHAEAGWNGLFYDMSIDIADHRWRIVVTPISDAYQTSATFAIVGASILFVATILLNFIFHKYINRSRLMHKIKSDASYEKAKMAVAQVHRERHLVRTTSDPIARLSTCIWMVGSLTLRYLFVLVISCLTYRTISWRTKSVIHCPPPCPP